MHEQDLPALYQAYIACLNRQDWASLDQHVTPDVVHNGRRIGLSGYREMLERDFHDIPDLQFCIEFLTCEAPRVAARLQFNCSPRGLFLGLPVNGRRVSFSENVFYVFHEGRIAEVWSVIDKAALERQL